MILLPYQRLTYAGTACNSQMFVEPVTREAIDGGLAWRKGQLVFADQPLAEVVAALNRYNSQQLRVASDALGQHRLGGAVPLTDVRGFVALITHNGIARAVTSSDPQKKNEILLVEPRSEP